MGEEKMEVEETPPEEPNQEVDVNITRNTSYSSFQPEPCEDVAAMGEEVKQTVLDRGKRREIA